MKKILATILALSLCIGLCACGGESRTKPAPEVQMIINGHRENTIVNVRIFPTDRDYDQWTAYAHYFVKSENDKEILRFKLEHQWGLNEKTQRDFEVESDEMMEVETNKWLVFPFSISATNLYFYRLTVYYGEQEEVLVTKTIYTPYKKAFYNESSFSDSAPEYHHINVLQDREQGFFDSCQYAVVDYAKTNHYSKINSITGWQAKTTLYLCVEYADAGGYETIWFAIKNDNPEKYVAHSNYSTIVPKGEGTTDQNVLKDYYYVEKALNKAIAE